jgi:drug/metabolite transporter (DMT)-like permease
MPAGATPAHPVLRAALWMAGALLSFVLMAIAGRELSRDLSIFEILFFRSLIGLVVIVLLLGRGGVGQVATTRIGLHTMRNVAHFVGQYGWFYGIAFIPLAEVFAIEFTSPVWTAILASALLGERMTGPRLAAIGFGLAGALVILRPGLAVIHPAALAVLIGAFGYAVSHTFTKKLSGIDRPLTILFYMTVIQLPIALVPAAFDWITPSLAMWPWLLAVGLTGLTAHYCITRAFVLADATVVMPLDYLRLPLGALSGFLFYGESVELAVFLGAALILGGNLLNIHFERKRVPAN